MLHASSTRNPRESPVSSTVFGGFGTTDTRILRVASVNGRSLSGVSVGPRGFRQDLPGEDRARHVFQEQVVTDGGWNRDSPVNGEIKDSGLLPEAAHFQFLHPEGMRSAARGRLIRRKARGGGENTERQERGGTPHGPFPSFAAIVSSRSACAASRRIR